MRPGRMVLLLSLIATPALGASEQAFIETLRGQCGMEFVGIEEPVSGVYRFEEKARLVATIECAEDEVRVPFVVGTDRSRTWIIRWIPELGLQLKHDHRHADGTPDDITNYGGVADDSGSAFRQSFPADAFTAELIPAAAGNVWTLSLDPRDGGLTYNLTRDGEPRFRAILYPTR